MESSFTIRDPDEHNRLCKLVDSDPSHYSVVNGINENSLLNTLEYFHVANGSLIPDIMHDILEGVLPLETRLMLNVSQICYILL